MIGNQFQQLFGNSGFFASFVKGGQQMIEFCQLYTPNLVVIDVDDSKIWTSVHAVRTIRDLSNLPFVGVSKIGAPQTLKTAQDYGFRGIMPINAAPNVVINSIQTIMTEAQTNNQPAAAPTGLMRLRELSDEVQNVTNALAGRIAEFGNEGQELFDYITSSSGEISSKLTTLSESDLADKELRHDFRNMIGSVTGFSELILMEPSLSPSSQQGFTRLRECSKEFVELLDRQKEIAPASA